MYLQFRGIKITILIHNDGKEKWQSFDARFNVPYLDYGFGSNQQEAIDDLKQKVNELIKILQNINYDETIEVAWDNTPIEEYRAKHPIKYHGYGFY